MPKWGCLLVNLGTPQRAEPSAVGEYLKEFLLDPEVIDLPWLNRQLLVRGLIVPFRKRHSARLYQKIWSDEGSPLLVHTSRLAKRLQEKLPRMEVASGFRYGRPSLQDALNELRARSVDRLFVLPLYPQYATSTTRTTLTQLRELGADRNFEEFRFLPSFHVHDFYLRSQTELIRRHHSRGSHLLFSFHGVPVRHLTKNHSSCASCEETYCCVRGDADCYRRQCLETAAALANELGLEKHAWTVGFQSRLGRARWIGPSTQDLLRELPTTGKRNLTVVAPGFAADCLETLEELDVAGRDSFLQAGGEKWTRVPCLNADSAWVNELSQWIKSELSEEKDGKTSPQPTK
jgi:ferrochelatase